MRSMLMLGRALRGGKGIADGIFDHPSNGREGTACLPALGLQAVFVAVAMALLGIWSESASADTTPTVTNESVSAVTSASATFSAEINPGEAETTYRLEYGTTNAYGTSAPIPDGYVGAGSQSTPVTLKTQDLQADTIYHFRFVASNAVGTEYGVDKTFHTQTVGQEFTLPDGRSYEIVSPLQKDGAQVATGGIIQAAEDGSAIAYLTSAPVVADPESNSTASQMLARRGTDGWSSTDVATPGEYRVRVGTGLSDRLFSNDLDWTVVEPLALTKPLSAEVSPLLKFGLYLRDTSTKTFQPLITSVPSGATEAEAEHTPFAGASPDFSHIVFLSHLALVPPALNAGEVNSNLYEWAGGNLSLVNILPDGTPTLGSAALGDRTGNNVQRAVSGDGNRVIWTSITENSALYMRDMAAKKTVQLDEAQGGTESGGGFYQTASSDASKVFFLDRRQLTSDANVGPPCGSNCNRSGRDLFLYEAHTATLTDLTPDVTDEYGAQVQVVYGASEDGSAVYFVARGALAEGAVSGANNLYFARRNGSAWEVKLIATLSEEDSAGFGEAPTEGGNFVRLSGRVSPNGRFMAFMSNAKLTGYDNQDAVSGTADQEVYIYDSESARLACASCNPTGARPRGERATSQSKLTMDPNGIWEGRWVAGLVPGWSQVDSSSAPYQPRYLSDSGRLFFDSSDSLVSQDSNGREDVYQYEPDGVGSCRMEGGCVSLISSGTDASDSILLDASVSGEDVFIMTREQLLREDFDASYDVYDARVCSDSHSCLSAQSATPPPCVTADSCKPAPSPQPSVFGAPASATFVGSGNLQAQSKPTSKKRPTKHKPRRKRPKHKRRRPGGHSSKARRREVKR